MKYDFDRAIDRTGTGSVKWDRVDGIFHGTGLLPLWVADMDFSSPPAVIEALERRLRHGIFGYTSPGADYYDAITGWFARRHGWDIKAEWIHFSPGVVPALNLLIQTFTLPGDTIIIQKPVYYPFMSAIRNNGREILNVPLVLEDGRYRMDVGGLRNAVRDARVRLFILCSPHNPVGRAWTKEELEELGRLCIEHDILVVSDEIHADIVYPGNTHVPFGSITHDFLMNSITCLSPSKTFNLAGLQVAGIVIANPEHQGKYRRALERLGLQGPNLFAMEALTAAYGHGEDWLGELLAYLSENLAFLRGFLKGRLPRITMIEPDATYLVWLDFRELGMDTNALKKLLRDKARVALDYGYIFGSPEGDGFARINIACPRSILAEALGRIEKALPGP